MNFEISTIPRIYFGMNQFQKIGQQTRELGSQLFIVANESTIEKSSFVKNILKNLVSEYHCTITSYIVKEEPTIEIIDSGVEKAKDFNPDVVIGIGGGSVIDSSKAIATLIMNKGSARDYMEVVGKGAIITKRPLPLIAIPTTAGTGSEVTKNAVIFAKNEQFKASIRSPLMVPIIAIIDPTLMLSVPPSVTATCGMDALTQLIEAYTSNKAHSLTDALALLGIKNAFNSLITCYENGSSLAARENMALAALLSGICLSNVGLGAVHGFASPLGGLKIPHGSICAALLAPTIEVNISELSHKNSNNPIMFKYSKLGKIISGKASSTINENCKVLIEYLQDLTRKLNIKPLAKYGLTQADFPSIVEKAKKASSMKYNPVSLDNEALTLILKKATLGTFS